MNYKNLWAAFADMDRYGEAFVGKALRARSLPGLSNLRAVLERPSIATAFAPILESIDGLAREQIIAAKSLAADAAVEKASKLAEARRIMPQLIEMATDWAARGLISAEDGARLDLRIAAAARELE